VNRRPALVGVAAVLFGCTRVVVIVVDRDDERGEVACIAVDADVADTATVEASTSPTSCAAGLTCAGISCCDSRTIPGGTFMQGRATAGPESDVCSTWTTSYPDCDETNDQPEFPSTVSTFALDTFEVTVGRFRAFVEAYLSSRPAAGAGANPKIAGSGWDAKWTTSLAADRGTLIANVACDPFYATWTDLIGANERKPINCVDWFTAFAFCAWDGGRLPTEAEWELAASGGEDRVVPREIPPTEGEPEVAHAIFDCLLGGSGSCTGVANIAEVGSVPLNVARWGHLDMAGNIWEWVIDEHAPYDTAERVDYANLAPGLYRVFRGGSFVYRAGGLRAALRAYNSPALRSFAVGLRCARRGA
jgi:sulfatase modifying factor 1